MDPDKLDRLAAAGFVVGSVQKLLGLSDEEVSAIDARMAREQPEMDLTLIKDLYGPGNDQVDDDGMALPPTPLEPLLE